MNFVIVVPARSGSKGIKNKNLKKLNKKPLIEYTLSNAKKSYIKNRFIITDDKKIKLLSSKYKFNVEYVRPNKTSKDRTSMIETIYHFYSWLKKKKIFFDYFIILQPTSPLRDFKDINNCIKILKKNEPNSLSSISENLEHPYDSIIKLKNKSWKYLLKKKKHTSRQQFKKTFFENGAIYASKSDLIRKKKLLDFKNHLFYKMPKMRSIDIDDLQDMKISETILKNK